MSLPGPRLEVAHWGRTATLAAALSGDAVESASVCAADSASELMAVRAAVAGVLTALVARIEQALPEALRTAPQAWDRVDHLLTVFDATLVAHIGSVRRRLEQVASGSTKLPPQLALRAAAVEGLVAVEAACGLGRLCERRLSSLIRLWVRSADDDLLPGGRPFLDVAAALKEAARAWA